MEPDEPLRGVTRVGDSAGRANDARELYIASFTRLVRVVALVGGDPAEAEDIVQEAFARLLPRWRVVAEYDDPEAWVRKVAFRLLSKRRRRLRQQAAHHSTELPAGDPPTGAGIDVLRALAKLPPGQRQVLVLHHLLDLPVTTVAAELGLPEGTVKSRLSRARSAMAALLGEENYHA
jgi:RNA polymerase sigma-70 factor, ECF subfamily